jgi:hypothetical protein
MNGDTKRLIEKFRAAGGVRVMRRQLPELLAAGITEQMLIEFGAEIVDDAIVAADEELVLVCVSAQRYFRSDNVFTVCDQCGAGIQHRPGIPARAKKLCFRCAEHHASNELAKKPNDQ